MVQRTAAGGISQQGRSATGVRVMNLKDDDVVSAVALVVDSGETDEVQGVQEDLPFDATQLLNSPGTPNSPGEPDLPPGPDEPENGD
jgi:DNA gyrase subunit A